MTTQAQLDYDMNYVGAHDDVWYADRVAAAGEVVATAVASNPPEAMTPTGATPTTMTTIVDVVGTTVPSRARRLSEIPRDPPAPLLLDRLDPDGHTVLYGTGGSGKGVQASHWTPQLVRDGHVVLIIDYESHPEEWARRIGALGGPDVLEAVRYVAPLTTDWTGVRGPIWAQARELRAIADDVGATFIIIDSIVPACGSVDPLKPEAASQYAAALQLIERPVLSLAHVTKDGDSRYPFGSVFWHNLARTTWSLTRVQGGALLTHRKANNYASQGRFLVSATWMDGLPREVWEQPYSAKLADLIAEVLTEPMNVDAIVKRLNEDVGDDEQAVKADSVRKALRRGIVKEVFTVEGTGEGARYSVR